MKNENPKDKKFDKHKAKTPPKTAPERSQKRAATDNPRNMLRLNRFIAKSGICSRREADELIKAGKVIVNNEIVTEMGVLVSRHDQVKVNNKSIKPEQNVYILINKPKDYITTTRDPQNRKTVMDLIRGATTERVFPVGRLDRNTSGVLLLTNDGELASELTHPRYNKKKIYQVNLDKQLTKVDSQQIISGVELEDGIVKADKLEYLDLNDKSQLGLEIHSGKNRVIRRIFEHLGYEVVKLDRVYFAGLTKKGISRGKWRFLTQQEIGILKMKSYE